MNNKSCAIIGSVAFDLKKYKSEITSNNLIICADGGFDTAREMGITPDFVVGDLDSCNGKDIDKAKFEYHKPEKDDTDTLLAVEKGINMGAKSFTLYGCLGGRLDHTMANLQLAASFSKKGYKFSLIGDNEDVILLTNDVISFSADKEGTLSVFAAENQSKGVSLIGLKYPLNNYTMTNVYPIGVSNEFIGVQSSIKVSSGTIFIIINKHKC